MSEPKAGRWGDLLPRVLSAVAMAAIGGAAIWAGGTIFYALVGLAVGLMVWELARMLDPEGTDAAFALGTLAGGILFALPIAQGLLGLVGCLIVVLCLAAVCAAVVSRQRITCFLYTLLLFSGSFALFLTRDNLGLGAIFWLVGIVIASDVAGYFAGKSLGGPKFWPAISPKKTWSGTVAGWIAAGAVGLLFGITQEAAFSFLILSLFLAFAAQMGDIAESAIKRRCGAKDSSNLIPGHGGVLDRFDALIGAAGALLLIAGLFGVPAGLLS